MKKLLPILAFLASPVFADVPHFIEATDCPAGGKCCPQALVCDFLLGCGSDGFWNIEGSPPVFSGLKQFNLNGVYAQFRNSSSYHVQCSYEGNLYADEADFGFILNGNAWSYGFLKQTATCNSTDSGACPFQVTNFLPKA